MMKNTILMVAACAALASGCKKKEKEKEPDMGSGSAAMMGSDKGSAAMAGSDKGMGSGSAPAMAGSDKGSAAPTGAMSNEDQAKAFEACWSYFSDAKWDDFKKCYSDDAQLESPGLGAPTVTGSQAIIDAAKTFHDGFSELKAEIQFEMFTGKSVIAAVLVHGTMQGKKVGFYFTHVVDLDDAHKVKHEWQFYDVATMMGQLDPNPKMPVRPVVEALMGPKEVVFSKGDDKEKANLATFAKLTEAFNKHDVKALDGLLDDKVMWSELSEPKDSSKKDFVTMMPMLWKSFSDLKFTVGTSWAAGDYVASVETFEGTNDGDGAMMKKTGKKISLPFLAIHKFDGGKNTMTWIVYQNIGFMTQLGMAPPMPAMGSGSGSGSAPAKK